MNFNICFLEKIEPHLIQAEIEIDSFVETFEVPTHYWSQKQYENQWKRALQNILKKSKSGLITWIENPEDASFLNLWALYREEEKIYIQEQAVFLEEIKGEFDPSRIEDFIEPRKTETEDGTPISEWETDIKSIKEYIETL